MISGRGEYGGTSTVPIKIYRKDVATKRERLVTASELEAVEVEEERVGLYDKVTFIVSILLLYPVSLLLMLHLDWNVEYWLGKWALYCVLLVPAWVVLSHILLRAGCVKSPVSIMLAPAALLFVVSLTQGWELQNMATLLGSNECAASVGKAKLETAWMAAEMYLDACVTQLANVTGVGYDEMAWTTPMQSCPGYHDAHHQYDREWTYLERMEKTQFCGGWCSPRPPLWMAEVEFQDSCSLAASQSFSGYTCFVNKQTGLYVAILLVVTLTIFFAVPAGY